MQSGGSSRSIATSFWRIIVASRGLLLILSVGTAAALAMLYAVPGLDRRVLVIWAMFVLCALMIRLVPLMHDNLHLLFAHLGLRTPRAPARYVAALFDEYAASYDRHLLVELRYEVPNHLRRIVGSRFDDAAPDILDMGCGTGLAGPLFAPIARQLAGVDLSRSMLAAAQEKRCYDRLFTADLLEYLDRNREAFDLVLAADVSVTSASFSGCWPACDGR